MKKPIASMVGAAASLLVASMTQPLAAADFYSGKTMGFIVDYTPGGGYDTYTRLIARHIGKSIPGHPFIVVENIKARAVCWRPITFATRPTLTA